MAAKEEFTKEELLKLSPAERVQKLKQFEEAKKKELEEAQKLLQDSEKELKSRKEQEVQEELIRRKVIEDLHKVQTLEQTVGEEPQRKEEIRDEQAEYRSNVQQAADLYSRLKNVLDVGIPLNPYDREKVEDVYNIINQIAKFHPQEDADKESIDDIARATKRIVKSLLGDYQSNVRYTP